MISPWLFNEKGYFETDLLTLLLAIFYQQLIDGYRVTGFVLFFVIWFKLVLDFTLVLFIFLGSPIT